MDTRPILLTDMDGRMFSEALGEAALALSEGEIPVGAVLASGGTIIGRGRNARERAHSPLAHAEIEALREAASAEGNWRFDGATLYVTLEPCAMCAGAIVQCRVARVVFGARDPGAGAAGSLYEILRDPRSSHRCRVYGGYRRDECAALLRAYFSRRRGGGTKGTRDGLSG